MRYAGTGQRICFCRSAIPGTGWGTDYYIHLLFYHTRPAIGILLCRHKNNIEAEFALRDINKPMGVGEFQLLENIPDNFKSSLPTVEELEQDLSKKLNDD